MLTAGSIRHGRCDEDDTGSGCLPNSVRDAAGHSCGNDAVGVQGQVRPVLFGRTRGHQHQRTIPNRSPRSLGQNVRHREPLREAMPIASRPEISSRASG